MQAGPQAIIVGQGRQRAGGVAIPLVQERGERCVHPLGTLRAPELLRFKHLSHGGRGWPFRTIPAGSPGPSALWTQRKDGAAIPTQQGTLFSCGQKPPEESVS